MNRRTERKRSGGAWLCTLTIEYKTSCASSCGAVIGARARRTRKTEEQKMKTAKNFNDVCRIMREHGYSLRYDYNHNKRTILVFENDYGFGHPLDMQCFIGNLFKVTSSKNKFYTVTRA